MGKRIVITGVPGVGKTTVVNGALEKLGKEGITYQSINFGTFMFEVASNQKIVSDRDGMRRLPGPVQKDIQREAAQAIAKIRGECHHRHPLHDQDPERVPRRTPGVGASGAQA